MKSLLKTLKNRAKHLTIGVTWSTLVGTITGCFVGTMAVAFSPAMLAGGLVIGAFVVPLIEYLFQSDTLNPQWYEESSNIVHY
jgi:uncharacterized membrane protein